VNAARRALPLALVLSAGCSSQFDNPFNNTQRTVAPRATAAVIFTSNLQAAPGAGRELFAVDADGSNVTQLTFCGTTERACDNSEVSPAPDRQRVIVRRRLDQDGNGRFNDADGGEALLFVDLVRGTEAGLVPATGQVGAIDWAPTGDVLVFSAAGEGGIEDLWRADPNGANKGNLTLSPTVRERGGRVDPGATVAVYERIEPDAKPAIFVYVNNTRQLRITTPGEGTGVLAGTPYIVGSDADPVFSPDGRSIAFRRLTGTGGPGTWSIMRILTDGTGLAAVASGPDYRGAPDWGPNGIVFEEADGTSGARRIVVTQPDGSGRRVLVTAPPGTDLSHPRWLPAQ
jgi:Tol biopolymer transport system component